MQQILVDFGTVELLGREISLRIYGYGLMLVLGFLTATGIAMWRARRSGEDSESFSHVAVLALIGGVVGARIAYVI
jgi:phosphatidylglycerol:prolipoprotein diacylglycerol transferase